MSGQEAWEDYSRRLKADPRISDKKKAEAENMINELRDQKK